MRKVGEGSKKASILFVGVVAKLIRVGMTSMHGKECIASFMAFVEVILVKLDVSKVTNSRTD